MSGRPSTLSGAPFAHSPPQPHRRRREKLPPFSRRRNPNIAKGGKGDGGGRRKDAFHFAESFADDLLRPPRLPNEHSADTASTVPVMHARELIELAALVSAHGPILVRGDQQIPAGGIEQYWTTSKVRLDRWTRSLKEFTRQVDAGAPSRERKWPEVRGVVEEILTGEILTRVWAAVLCAYDQNRGSDEAEPIGRSVMIGHSEARHRVLTLLSHARGMDARSAVQLNRLRRHAERWTDLLVGRLADIQDVGEFAVDAKRAMDFAEDAPADTGLKPAGSPGRCCWPRSEKPSNASWAR